MVFAVWVVLTAALIGVARTLPWKDALHQMTHARAPWLLAAVTVNVGIIVLWAAEWRLLAPRAAAVSYGRMFECVAAMAAVLNSVPFFAGEATGVAWLITRLGLTRGAALSVLALDQLMSGVGKLAVLAATALVVPLPVWLRGGILGLTLGVALLLAVLVSLAHRWERMRNSLSQDRLWAQLLARGVSIGRHLDALRESGRVTRVSAIAVAKKTVELTAIMCVQMAFGMDPTIGASLIVLACISIANIAPISPANVGVYEAAAFAGYRYAGVSADMALGLALVQHLCFLVPMLTTGYALLTLRQLPRARVMP